MVRRAQELSGVDPRLVAIVQAVGQKRDIIVIQGARTVQQELDAMKSHHSELKDPMNSKHVVDPVKRPQALAVDIGPWPLDWKNIQSFIDLAVLVKECAQLLNTPIVWGGDWTTLKDYDHYELT